MKNEHATSRANDIKQKRLLGGNPAQKKNYLLTLCEIFFEKPMGDRRMVIFLF